MQRIRLAGGWLAPVVLLAAAVLTSCGSEAPAEQDPTMSPSASPNSSPGGSPSGTPSAGSPTVSAAIADLADRTGASADRISVVAVEEVTWRDGSLGCPQPGYSYTQALVDGLRITLSLDGTEYEYHSGGSKPPFWCEAPTQ